MAERLKITYLTTDDPIYLPAFFERVLERQADRTEAVYVVPPLYKRQTSAEAAIRYARTFGVGAAAQLSARVLAAKLKRVSIAATCARRRVRCEEVGDVNAPGFLERLRREGAGVLVSVSCPQIFKRPLIQLPRHGILNIHGAILPQYRGVMPSFWMMANGERQAGVTIYFVDEKIDSGEMVGQRTFEILPDESLDGFLRRSKAIAADLLLDVLERLEAGALDRRPIDLKAGSYYSWPDLGAVRRFRGTGRKLW